MSEGISSPHAVSSYVDHKRRKVTSEKAKANYLCGQLRLRLQYAKLKVEHGWQRQNLNEVENLYFRRSHKTRPLTAPSGSPPGSRFTPNTLFPVNEYRCGGGLSAQEHMGLQDPCEMSRPQSEPQSETLSASADHAPPPTQVIIPEGVIAPLLPITVGALSLCTDNGPLGIQPRFDSVMHEQTAGAKSTQGQPEHTFSQEATYASSLISLPPAAITVPQSNMASFHGSNTVDRLEHNQMHGAQASQQYEFDLHSHPHPEAQPHQGLLPSSQESSSAPRSSTPAQALSPTRARRARTRRQSGVPYPITSAPPPSSPPAAPGLTYDAFWSSHALVTHPYRNVLLNFAGPSLSNAVSPSGGHGLLSGNGVIVATATATASPIMSVSDSAPGQAQ